MYFYNVRIMCRQCTATQAGRAAQCSGSVPLGRWCNVRARRSSAQCSGSVPLCMWCNVARSKRSGRGVWTGRGAAPGRPIYSSARDIFYKPTLYSYRPTSPPKPPLPTTPTGGPLYTNKRNPLHCPAQNFSRPQHAPHPLRPARPPAPASLGRQRVQQGIAPDSVLVVLGESLPRPRIDPWSYAPVPERTGHGLLFLASLVLCRPSTGITAVHLAAVPADERRSALFACLPVL